MKLLEENIAEALKDTDIDNYFLDKTTPQAQATETKLGSWDSIKSRGFWAAKKTISSVNWRLMEWEKIFSGHIPNKWLIARMYQQLKKLNYNNNNYNNNKPIQ